ncbi:MAG: Cof-type HAD-IIB family hydrolase [Clostridiales bacterium]|jgi:Cof subfamily protein (haloacid dehalogenase superfamily)|nr:Cof-type HAD-IIB family hydrolase [Clostridiales bacterium]
MYKIVAIDADGTLLTEQSVPEDNRRAINEAQSKGVHIALCSGRSSVSLKKFAAQMGLVPGLTHIIAFNGGLVFDGFGKQLMENRMGLDLALYIISKVRRFNRTMAVYTEPEELVCEFPRGDEAEIERYTSGSLVKPTFIGSYETELKKNPYKLILLGETYQLKAVEAHLLAHGRDMEYDMSFSSKRLLEFSHINTNKGAGLKYVCERLGFDIAKDAAAIGDSYNDLSMIEAAALGCCMANGEEGVKALADYVTERDNVNCGVAEVFDKFILK